MRRNSKVLIERTFYSGFCSNKGEVITLSYALTIQLRCIWCKCAAIWHATSMDSASLFGNPSAAWLILEFPSLCPKRRRCNRSQARNIYLEWIFSSISVCENLAKGSQITYSGSLENFMSPDLTLFFDSISADRIPISPPCEILSSESDT